MAQGQQQRGPAPQLSVTMEAGEPFKAPAHGGAELWFVPLTAHVRYGTHLPNRPYTVRVRCVEDNTIEEASTDIADGSAHVEHSFENPGRYTFYAQIIGVPGTPAISARTKVPVGIKKPDAEKQPVGGYIDMIGNPDLWVPHAYVHDANDKPLPGILVTFRSRRDPVQFPVFTNVHGMAEKPYPMSAGDKPEKVTVTVSRVPKMHADFGLEPPMALWGKTNNKIAKWMLILTVVWTIFNIGFVGFSDPPKQGVATIAPEDQVRDFLHRGFEINSTTGKVQPKAAPQPKVEESGGWQSLMSSIQPWSWWLVLGLWVFSPVYTLFALREELASLWRGTMNIWENQRLEIIPSAEGPQAQRAPAGFLSQTAAAVAAQAAPKFGVKLWEFAKNVASVMVGNVITH